MIKIFKCVILFFMLVIFSGCKKYLDLKPEDSYIDEQVFSNPATIRQALNGIYNGLTSEDLYGSDLTMEALEIMAQRYNTSGVYSWWQDIANNYTSAAAPGTTFDNIWKQAYGQILKINNFIRQLEKIKGTGIITEAQTSQLKGETVALRAFLHFDLVRLFGPAYADNDSEAGIPYNSLADGKLPPILTIGETYSKIIDELKLAEQLLANDPIKTTGVNYNSSVDFYSGLRNRRMNYYAVKALQARVNIYFNKKEEANAAAKLVIAEVESVFPWTAFNDIIGNANPDRIFSSEVIFGLYNPNLYATHNRLFSSALSPAQMLVPTSDQLSAAFEGNENDYRYNSTWFPSSHGFRTFYKYADLSDVNKSWRYFQPLIRKSEMYYIAAETEPDHAQAVGYLNAVRFNRGLPDLPDDAPLSDYGGEIEKEYVKEFYGEGQLYFYLKRINPWWLWPPIGRVPFPVSENQLR